MCFKAPKTPKVYIDPELRAQQLTAREEANSERAAAKEQRTEQKLAALSGRLGRGGLLSGGRGGAGFAAPMARSLFNLVGG